LKIMRIRASAIRTGSDYELTVAMTGIPQGVHVLGGTVTLWGVPAPGLPVGR
jgi:hypothetical protein